MKIHSNRQVSKLVASLMVLLGLYADLSYAKNSFLVAPGRVEFDLSKPKTESFIITNNGDGKIRLSIKPVYFEINSNTIKMGKHLKPETASDEDLSKFIRVSPRTLSLQSGNKRNVRISIRAPQGKLTDGDYRAHLLVSMMEVSQMIGQGTEAEGQLGMSLALKMETGVAIIGHMGEPQPNLAFICQKSPDSGILNLLVTTASPWGFRGRVEVFPGAGAIDKPSAEVPLVTYRESQKNLDTQWQLANDSQLFLRWTRHDGQVIGSKTCQIE